MNIQSKVTRLPAAMLCEIACFEAVTRAKVEALLGPFVDMQVDAQLSRLAGPIHLTMQGELGQVKLDAQLQGGNMTLNSPFHAEVTATPELGQSVLQDLLPILSGMQQSNERLSVTIDPEAFALPLRAPSLANIHIGRLTINLGNVTFTNEGQLGSILSLLNVRSQEAFNVWFTPIYVSLEEGVITIHRFDMLALQRFPLATWGTVDVPGDKIDMVVGLSGKSLQNALRVPIPTLDYMMQFPLRGPIGSASIDHRMVAAKIAALTAQVAGGPQGLVIGTVIGSPRGLTQNPKRPPRRRIPFLGRPKLRRAQRMQVIRKKKTP